MDASMQPLRNLNQIVYRVLHKVRVYTNYLATTLMGILMATLKLVVSSDVWFGTIKVSKYR